MTLGPPIRKPTVEEPEQWIKVSEGVFKSSKDGKFKTDLPLPEPETLPIPIGDAQEIDWVDFMPPF